MDVQVIVKTPAVSVGAVPGAILLVWLQPPSTLSLRDVQRAMPAVLKAARDGVAVIAWTLAAGGLPSGEVRTSLQETIRQLEPYMRSVSNVIEGEGFQTAALRSLLTGFYLATRPPYPVKVHASLDESVAWTLAQWKSGAPAPTPDALRAAARSLLPAPAPG